MVKVVVEKELRLTLLTFKFLGSAVLLVTLMATSTFILTLDWQRRLDLFQSNSKRAQQEIQDATTYSGVILRLENKPRLANLIHQGFGDRLGTTIALSGRYDVPHLSGTSDDGVLQGFVSVDFAHLVGLILSLIALVLSYDLVNGDRAQGTLQLTLASGISRYQVLLGKYLGTLLALLAPFAAAVLVWLAILIVKSGMEVDAQTWARFGLAILLSLLYGSAFVWLGLLVSAFTQRAATALVLCLLIWTATVVIYPATVMQLVSLLHPLREAPTEEIQPSAFVNNEALLNRVLAERGRFRQQAVDQLRLAQGLMRLSPLASYDFATAALAGTGIDQDLARWAAARKTDEALRSWQRLKAQRDPQRELVGTNLHIPLDLSGLPAAAEANEPVGRTLYRIAPDVALLLAFNVVLLIAAQAVFRRAEIRL